MSREPALALLIGFALLDQVPATAAIVGIAFVVTAGVGAARGGAREGAVPTHHPASISRGGSAVGNAMLACARGFAEHERAASELLSGQTPACAVAGLLATFRIGAPALTTPEAAGSMDANFLLFKTITGVTNE